MTTDVNVLLRGQSNALLFDYDGGSAALEKAIEAKLPDVNVHVIAQYYQTDNTIYSGTAFLDWPKDGEQQGLLNVLKAEPADMRDNPTITLWMHNEADGNNSAVTTDGWVSAVQADATLVRDALGQSAATTPYVFTYVPYAYSAGNSPANIQAGMARLSADATFNASFANHAMDGLAMDGYPAGSHMGVGDAMTVAARLADYMTPEVAALAHVGAPPVITTPVVRTIGSGTDSLVLKINQDVYKVGAQYTVSVDGTQIGDALTAGAVHGSGQTDVITVKGDWAAGAHKVTVNFLNDTWGGTSTTDSNLHVDGITYNGKALAAGTADLMSNGPVDFAFTEAAAPDQPGVTVGAHLGTAPVLAGASAAQVWTGQLEFAGSTYQTYGAHPAWGSGAGATLKPAKWDAAYATKLAFDNFVQTDIDLAKFGSNDFDLLLASAKRGSVSLGDGDDHVTWVAHSNGSTTAAFSNTMTIKTGGGDDVVKVTAAGLSSLADYDKTGNGSLYNPSYDGRYSTADVTFGSGHDSVTVEGKAMLVLHAGTGHATAVGGAGNDLFYAGSGGGDFTGGAGRDTFIVSHGNAHATIEDFTAGQDRLKFLGSTAADIHSVAATQNGVAGLTVTYGSAGDSIFLAHAKALAATDMLFA